MYLSLDMGQYSLYHNYVHYTVPCTVIPNEDHDAIELIKDMVQHYLYRIWKPEDRYVLVSDKGDHFIYDNGTTYRMADSG
jgi:hypothetical protein